MPYRRFFMNELNDAKNHHIHMVELNTEFWHRHLKYRNHLRENDEDRDLY